MGGYDCYCALCCGPLHLPVVGSSCKPALHYRDWRLQQMWEARRAGEEYESDDDAYDEYLENGGSGTEVGGAEEDEDEEWWIDDEKRAYDPRIVSDGSLQWVRRVRGLGYNLNAHGTGRAYFTGPCLFDDANVIMVSRGDDPNQPSDLEERQEMDCYLGGRITDTAVYPFHESCFKVLERVLQRFLGGSDDASDIDKDILWTTFTAMVTRDTCLGRVNYGDISGCDQYWESIAGEEFSVSDPMYLPLLKNKEAMTSMVKENKLVLHAPDQLEEKAMPPSSLQEPSPGYGDPFGKLSTEVLWNIALHLPVAPITSLAAASPSFRRASRTNGFWKRYYGREMAWAWDVLAAVAAQTGPNELDYRQFCLFLDRVATPELGMSGPFLALANRRRIWSACEDVAGQYLQCMSRAAREAPDVGILEQCGCQRMPFINLPRAGDGLTATQRSLWVYGWEEIQGAQAIFEVIWDENNSMVGLGIMIGTTRRILGMDDANNPRLRKTAALILLKFGWIRGLIIHSKRLILGEDDTTTAVSGITVLQGDNKETILGTPGDGSNRRHLIPSNGNRLVGAEAQMNGDGVIMRLGILECPGEEIRHQFRGPDPESPLTHLLWDRSARSILEYTPRLYPPPDFASDQGAYILSPSSPIDDVSTRAIVDMSSLEQVVWYADKLERISLYVSEDGGTVLGIRVQFIRRFWEPKRYVGHRDTDENGEPIEWPETQMTHLDLCGVEGERVVKIAISPAVNPKGLQLTTNRAHQVTAGYWDDQDCKSVHLAEGLQLDGIAISWTPKEIEKDKREILSVMALAGPDKG